MSLCSPANRADVHGCNGSMLIQAIRSHIHFSQLSAWLSRSKGSIPSRVIYRSVLKYDQSATATKLNTVSSRYVRFVWKNLSVFGFSFSRRVSEKKSVEQLQLWHNYFSFLFLPVANNHKITVYLLFHTIPMSLPC